MNILLLYVSIAWVTLCVLFVGLGFDFSAHFGACLRHVPSNGSRRGISTRRLRWQLDLAMDETVGGSAEFADTFDALFIEDTVTLVP
jgi:hypothetical protein